MQLRNDRFAPPKRKKAPSKLIAGLTAFLATGIITASGFAGAAPNQGNGNGNHPGHNNGHHNGQMGHHPHGGGPSHGYGGGNTSIINNINLNLNNSNNNAITIIIHVLNN